MAWTTGSDLLLFAADTLRKSVSELPDSWARQADVAVELAYVTLLSTLATSGYSAEQIARSDQATTWNQFQGLYELAGLAGGFGNYPREWFERFNIAERLKSLEKIALTRGGVPIAPDGSSDVGGFAHGLNRSARLLSDDPRVRTSDPVSLDYFR